MRAICTSILLIAVGLVAGLLIAPRTGTAVGPLPEEGAPGGGPRYTIVATAGHSLIVTDNKTNTLCFYTIDKDKGEYSDLTLHSVDLTKVGDAVLKPKTK